MSKDLWFVPLFPPPVQNTGFPWGCWDLFYTTWTVQKAQVFTNTCVSLAYCLWHADSQGMKYFPYSLWVKYIASDIQEEVSIGYLKVPSWPYCDTSIWTITSFKGLIPKSIFGYHCRKWSTLLLQSADVSFISTMYVYTYIYVRMDLYIHWYTVVCSHTLRNKCN